VCLSVYDLCLTDNTGSFLNRELTETADKDFFLAVVLAIYTQAYVSNVCSLTHCLASHSHI
jgi:hypothetical protein